MLAFLPKRNAKYARNSLAKNMEIMYNGNDTMVICVNRMRGTQMSRK